MSTRLFLATALAVLHSTSLAAEKVTLYGDDDYPPYSYVENGQFKGIYVDFLKRVATRLAGSYDVDLKPIPWKRGLAMLEYGDAVALFPPYLRKERTYIQPYSETIYTEKVVIVCNDQAMNKPRKTFPDDFGDVTMGVNAGFQLADNFVNARKAGKIKVEEVKGTDANLEKLASNRIGCYANDRLSTQYTLKKMKTGPHDTPVITNLHLNEVYELSSEDVFVGYSLRNMAPYKADFIDKLNASILEARKSGAMSKLIGAYAM
ncbi:MAG: transporter substrate-binding domain-containing protein [Burkholderiales bacterium]|nr:transporter substrate-binding domain-containing protein [Burkholderiales bacterium]